MGKAEYKVSGGKMIKVQLTEKDNRIQKIKVTGDFFLHPEELIDQLEEALTQCLLNESGLTEHVRTFMEKREATLLGASPEDFARCIMMAGEKVG